MCGILYIDKTTTQKKGETKMRKEKMIDMIIEAYVMVMGREKWNNLTAQEQHDVIMTIVKDLLNRV